MSRHAIRRCLAGAATAALAILGLAGCTTTTTSCSNRICTVSFGGAGAQTDLETGDLTNGVGSMPIMLSYQGTSGQTASLSVDGSEVTCRAGETLSVSYWQVTCAEIEAEALTIEISYPGSGA